MPARHSSQSEGGSPSRPQNGIAEMRRAGTARPTFPKQSRNAAVLGRTPVGNPVFRRQTYSISLIITVPFAPILSFAGGVKLSIFRIGMLPTDLSFLMK